MRVRIRRGEALVASVIKGFDGMMEDLEVAGQQIKERRQRKMAAMVAAKARFVEFEQRIQAQDVLLQTAQQRAEVVRLNIAKLVGA